MPSINEDKGPTLWVVNTIFIVLATLAVIGRFYARKLRSLPLGADDWTICFSLTCNWTLYGLFVGCRKNGLGRHRDLVPPAKVTMMAELLYIFQIFYALAPPSVKLSLLFLYKRLFERSAFLRLVYVMMGICVAWAIILTFMAIFNCNPVKAFWTREGECIDFKSFAIGYAVVNILTDFIIWLMPIPMVWRIQLPIEQKIALSLIFALGLFDCAAAMARLFLSMLVLNKTDITWYYAAGYMWSIIEVSTGILCTCLPTMRVLLKAAFSGRLARALGLSSGKDSRQRSDNQERPRSKNDEEVEGARASKSPHYLNGNIFGSQNLDWNGNSRQGIVVCEEINVELQPLEPTGSGKTIW